MQVAACVWSLLKCFEAYAATDAATNAATSAATYAATYATAKRHLFKMV